MADVEANVEITVEGAGGLRDAAAEAEALKEALDQDRDAALEAAAAQDALKHSASGSAAEAKRLRGEIGLTAAELQQKLPQIASVGQDAQARLNSAARDIGKMGAGGGKGAAGFEQLQRDMGTYRTEAEKAAEATASLERDIRSAGLSGGEASMAGGGALEKYATDLEKLKADLAGAEPRINAMNDAVDRSARDSGIAAHALGNWHGAISDLGSGGDIQTAISSSKELDGALADMRRSGDGAARALSDITGGGGGGVGKDVASLASDGEKAATSFGDLGGAFGKLSGMGMPALIGGIAAAATTIGPVLLSAATGAVAFGALAYPAFYKVKAGLTAVTAAQQAYQQAQAVAKADPTKANLTAQQKALDSLKATWSTMPAPIAASVRAIQNFGHAWSQAGKKSGIQQDFLKDIPKAINDAKGLIPATVKLAQGFAPVISGMLSDFGKFEKSKGFNQFISNVDKQIPGAAKALGSLGNAFGSLVTSLTSSKNMKAGDQLLSSVSGLLKAAAPGAVSGLDKLAVAMTKVSDAASKSVSKKSGASESGQNMILGWAQSLGKGLEKSVSPYAKVFSGAVPWLQKHGSSQMDTWVAKHTGLYIPGQGAPDPRLGGTAGLDVQKAMAAWEKGGGAKNLSPAKLGLGGKAALTMHVKVQTDGAAKAKSDLAGIHKAAGKPAKVEIKASVTGVAKAKSDLTGLKTAASGHFASPKITVSVTGASAGAAHLRQVGTAATAMASSVSAGGTRATAAASAMAAGIRGAIAPLPGEFTSVGTAAGQGMAAGIRAGTGAAVAAAAAMAHAVENAARVTLQTHSPSKVFQKLGAQTIQGYVLGLLGGKAQVQAALNAVLGAKPFTDSAITSATAKLKKALQVQWEHGKIDGWHERTLTSLLDTDNGKLMKLAKQRQSLINQIKAADALASSVQAAAIAGADVTKIAPNTQAGLIQANLASAQPGSSQNPYQNIQQGLQQQLGQIKQFRNDIVKLKKEGLDKTSVKQLLAAGVSGGGLSTAEQMLGEGGGGVKQIAKLQAEIAKASKQLGVTGANAAYESGSQIGGALAAGLKSALKSVDSAMASIAKTLVTSLMTALGASSKDIKAALKKLDKELGISGGSPSGGGGGEVMRGKPIPKPTFPHLPGPIQNQPGGGGGVMRPVVLHANVIVNVDGKQLATTTQQYQLQKAGRNPAVYPRLPGRAA